MAQTKAGTKAPASAALKNGTASGGPRPSNVAAKPHSATHSRKAYELTDERGAKARAWRSEDRWIVEADNDALRDRVTQALKTPLWVTEDARAADGSWWSTRIEIEPNDPRYANRLLTRWDQIGLADLDVEVVSIPDLFPAST
jgi:hypothetical protein